MSGEAESVQIGPGEGFAIANPVGGAITFKVRGDQSAGTLTVFESEIPPGAGPPLHVHAREDEAWYALEGELRVRVGDAVTAAPAGAFFFAPRGVAHTFQNVGDRPARVLVVFTPAGMDEFFQEFATTAGAPDAEVFRQVGAFAGMEVVGPPLAQSHPHQPA
jgi:quercetin dioxygenase-like cupin family protein